MIRDPSGKKESKYQATYDLPAFYGDGNTALHGCVTLMRCNVQHRPSRGAEIRDPGEELKTVYCM